MTLFRLSRLLPALTVVCVVMLGVRGFDFWQVLQNPEHLPAQNSAPAHTAPSLLGVGFPAQANPAGAPSHADSPTAEHTPKNDKEKEKEQKTTAEPTEKTAEKTTLAPPGSLTGSLAAEGETALRGNEEAIPRSFSPAEVEVLQNLSRRRIELDKREAALNQREALIAAAAQQVDTKVAELQSLKSELKDMLNQVDEQQKQRIASLVKIYETMKPRDAAAVIEKLEMPVALSVLEAMREAKSAPILAAMPPEKASQITVEMSTRTKLPDMPQD